MEILSEIVKKCIGANCFYENDSKNFIDKDKFESLNGRKNRIIRAIQDISTNIDKFIKEVLENIKPYFGEDIEKFIYNLEKIKVHGKNIEEALEVICSNKKRFTCQACKKCNELQLDVLFCEYYLQIAILDINIISKGCYLCDLFKDENYHSNHFMEKIKKAEYFNEIVENFNELNLQYRGWQRLIMSKQYCVYHTEEIRNEFLDFLNGNNQPKNRGTGSIVHIKPQ